MAAGTSMTTRSVSICLPALKLGCRLFTAEFTFHPLRLTLKNHTVNLLTYFLICPRSFLPSFRLLPVFVSLCCCDCLHNFPPVRCKAPTCSVALSGCFFSRELNAEWISRIVCRFKGRTVPFYSVFTTNVRLVNLCFSLWPKKSCVLHPAFLSQYNFKRSFRSLKPILVQNLFHLSDKENNELLLRLHEEISKWQSKFISDKSFSFF